MKDTYCGQAYYNIHIEGEHKSPCCLIYNTDYWTKQPVTDAFNSDEFNNIRKAFDKGQKHPACQTCWNQENATGSSPRLSYTQRLRDQSGIDQNSQKVYETFNTCSNLIFVRQFCECKTMINAYARRDSTKTTFKKTCCTKSLLL